MPSFIPARWTRHGRHARINEDDLLEDTPGGPLLPEPAQLRSQDAIFESRRHAIPDQTQASSQSSIYSVESSPYIATPFADSNPHLASPPNSSDDITPVVRDPRLVRLTLSPRSSSLNIETVYKEQSHTSVDVASNPFSDPLGSHTTSDDPPPSRWLKPFIAAKTFFLAHVNPKTVWRMIDIREIFWPFTWKKYATLLMVAMLITVIVTMEFYFRWIESAMAVTRRNVLAILVVVIGLEPAMIALMLIVARIPDHRVSSSADVESQMGTVNEKAQVPDDGRTALVIPCHNSDHQALTKVLESAYPHFRPQSIFIVDNARTMHPKNSDFRNFLRSEHPGLNYIWSPIGSKNAAQLVGAVAAKSFEFIFTVDDDVCIPASFRAPTHMINDITKGVAFPLKAVDASGKVPLFLVAWQDCEYRMAGLVKLAESDICGVLYPHGAGWFCERETMIDLISNYHSLDFIAEDVNTGISMQKMKKRIAFDASCVLETEVPTTFIGPGLNWYEQRVRSWEMGRHGRILAFLGRMLFSFNGQTTLHGILWQKFVHFYSIACIIVDWVRVPVLVTMGANGAYWRQAGLLMLVSIIPVMVYNYISCRRRLDFRTPFWGAMTIPIYKQIYAVVSLIGAIRSIVFYIGGHNKPKTVHEMIKDNDPRAFWLDPRFETNPAFLADEIEEESVSKE